MADDVPPDPNNPQRAEVLRRERAKIEDDIWLQMRIEAILADAGTIAAMPRIELTEDDFVGLARHAYVTARERLKRRTDIEVAQRDFALASATNEKEETKS